MKKQLSILFVTAGIFLAGCAGICDGTCTGCSKEKVIVLDSTAHFAFDSAVLSSQDSKDIKDLISQCKASKGKIYVNGYTDNTGAHDYNVGLSQRRADSIAAFLVSKGVEKDRIVPRGHGATNFVASNDTAAGRAKNRRAEVVIK
ncbi:MAG: OmpA family protein [Lactobacillales bacterium]|nr:OmpA family protein [Lactobacillales bacterium]